MPRAIARLAIGIDRAAVPHRFQRIDGGLHDTAVRLSIDRSDKADAARVGLAVGPVHAMFGEVSALVDHC